MESKKMLVLNRRESQQIVAGDITFTICKISRNRVSVGISAPRSTKIMRKELVDAAEPITNDIPHQEEQPATAGTP